MYGRETERKATDIIRIDQPIIEEKNSNGTTIRKYTRGKLIGKVTFFFIQGGFAKCYELFPHENNKKYAVKVIEKASLTRSKAKEKVSPILILVSIRDKNPQILEVRSCGRFRALLLRP